MKRREALKSITLSSGALVSSASILGLLQSCVADEATWQPKLFSKLEGQIITVLCDLILPNSDTPSASMVNVPQFIDLMMADVYKVERGEKFRKGINLFNDVFRMEIGEGFAEATEGVQVSALSTYLDIPSDQVEEVKRMVKDQTSDTSSDQYYIYCFLTSLRNMAIGAYYQSEKIGEEVLAYDPIPTRFDGCVPFEEVGKVWSL